MPRIIHGHFMQTYPLRSAIAALSCLVMCSAAGAQQRAASDYPNIPFVSSCRL